MISDHTAPATRGEIASIELFRGASTSALDEARKSAQRTLFGKEARIFDQGDGRVRAYALLEGGVRMSQSGKDGAHIVLRFIAPGEIFGAMALFTDRRYAADADTMTRSVILSWGEADLVKLMSRYPQIAIDALKTTARRLKDAQNRLREVSTQSVERRVAHTLIRLVRQFGKVGPVGTTIDLPLRRKDIADIAGTTLFSVSRALTNWEKHGTLVTRNHVITVIRLADLRAAADVIRI
jgi:CRP-like cAMP-binding protein